MLHLTETLLELSVLSMALSLLLISRIVEAATNEEALIGDREIAYTLSYFSSLFFTAIASLLIILADNVIHDTLFQTFLPFIPVLLFVRALFILRRLVYKIHKVTPYLQKVETRGKSNELEESV